LQFLGVGWQEVFLVMVLLLVVVGPQRLPTVAYQIGRAVRTMQMYARAVRDEFSEEITYLEDQYKTVRGEVDETRRSLREETAKMDAELRAVTASAEEGMKELTTPLEQLPALAAGPAKTAETANADAPRPNEEAAKGPPLVF
jgi:sec-independent protein translocase protein TatB